MRKKKGLRSAHRESVNSVFVSFDRSVVISVDDKSIRVWDPVNGLEIYETEVDSTDDSVVPGLSAMFRSETVNG